MAELDGAVFVVDLGLQQSQAGVEGEEEQGKRFAKAARDAGVQRFVYTSVGSAHRKTGIPHFENKHRIEETVRGLGFPSHAILRPVFFMENLLSPGFLQGDKLVAALDPGTSLQMIAVADVGAVAAAALVDPDRVPGGRVEIAGDELTGEHIAQAYGKDAGLPSRYEALPLEALRGNTDLMAMFTWLARTPSYRADFTTTAALRPEVQDLPTWLAAARERA